jgi:hypothetical protein
MGPGDWHEMQMIMRPTGSGVGTTWTLTFGIDDWLSAPTAATFTNASGQYLWFNMNRRGTISNLASVVFYEYDGLADTTPQLGPDLRIYCDKPDADEQVEWNRSSGASNAEAVATGTVTQAQSSITESGVNKADQYAVSNSMPTGLKVLSMTHEAYFSRMLPNPAFVQVGMQVDGVDVDEAAVQISSPVNSWTYLNQRMEKNPVTGISWTAAEAQDSKFRIKRADNTPVTTMLIHADTATAGITPYAVNVGGGFNRATGSAVISTTDPKFGTGCISIPSGSSWVFSGAYGGPGTALGASDWTIECWVKTTASGTACIWQIDTALGGGAYGGVMLTPTTIYIRAVGVDSWQTSSITQSFRDGAWHHVAVCRQESTYYVWVDGLMACAPLSNTDPIRVLENAAGVLTLGSTASNPSACSIDEVRISRGARYITPFTPPTGPFTS